MNTIQKHQDTLLEHCISMAALVIVSTAAFAWLVHTL